VLGPPILEWEEGQPLQPGYHIETRVRKGLVIGGSVSFGVMYLFTALAGAIATDVGSSGYTPLFIPGVGPIITVGTTNQSATGAFALVLDGLIQSGGLAMLLTGILVPRTVQVRNDIGRPFVRPTPMTFGANSAGAGLVGAF
jgi:hypothetical protein